MTDINPTGPTGCPECQGLGVHEEGCRLARKGRTRPWSEIAPGDSEARREAVDKCLSILEDLTPSDRQRVVRVLRALVESL